MMFKYKHKETTWVDLLNPTEDEIKYVIEEYDLSTEFMEEMGNSTMFSRFENRDSFVYLVLHFPSSKENKRLGSFEMDFILKKDLILTIHYEELNTVYNLTQNLEIDAILEKDNNYSALDIFYTLIKEFYKNTTKELDVIYEEIEDLKSKIFLGNEERMVGDISFLNRKILDFKQAIRFHESIFESMHKESNIIFVSENKYLIERLKSSHHKMVTILDGHKEMLKDIRDTNDSLLSAKTNKTMRVLTIISFVVFPLTFFATLFSMITDIRIINSFEQFLYLALIMILAGLLVIIYFKKNKWLL